MKKHTLFKMKNIKNKVKKYNTKMERKSSLYIKDRKSSKHTREKTN